MHHYWGAVEVGKKIQAREVSSAEITQTQLDRIAELDPTLKSYATVLADQALADAKTADKEIANGKNRGPLHGVPIAVKDLCYTKGTRTMGGLGVLRDFIPDFDATVVTRLHEAGAILLGKLNLTEGAMAGYHPDFDAPVNPWNAERWSGVSSSGSGVATAAGLCYASLGSDTGGSIRFPAGANGTVGLKPTWGLVSRHGVLALADSLDHIGPLTRRVEDAAAVLEIIGGPDPSDPTSHAYTKPELLNTIASGIKGLRIGVDVDYNTKDVHPEVVNAVRDAIQLLADNGAEVVEIHLPPTEPVAESWATICAPEAVLAHERNYPSRKDEYGPWFAGFLELGAQIPASEYARANNLRITFNIQLQQAIKNVDLVACPGMPYPAFPITKEVLYGPMAIPEEGDPMNVMLRYTAPHDFSGSPTLSLPCGFASDGMPLSLQFFTHHAREDILCRAGQAYESITTWHTQHPMP